MSDPRPDQAPGWVVPAMRLGYSARAVVYVIMGCLALAAAWSGGQAEGQSGVMDQIRGWPMGTLLLWVIGLGLLCYAVWRFICAGMDLEDRGHDGEGIIARIGQTVTGAIHAALGVSAIRAAMGGGSGGGENGDGRVQDWTQMVLEMPGGRWIVGIGALIVIGAGVFYAWKGYKEKFRDYLIATPRMEKLVPWAKLGLYAFGFILGMIGVFLMFAALRGNPAEAGGFGQAFETIRAQSYGQFLLTIVALGMICYAVYNVIEAAYRVVPRAADDSIRTLADKARAEAKKATT